MFAFAQQLVQNYVPWSYSSIFPSMMPTDPATTCPSSVPGKIPTRCTVLVVGGGPGGSYAAAALALENVDVVCLEADVFPRYHIGESMLASMRHLLRIIDLDEKFKNYGFKKKVGAAFKLNKNKREGYTDFIAAGGPENYAWNVVRSEADEIFFRHAGECGAHIFDGVKVTDITFSHADPKAPDSRPVSAVWVRKSDGVRGEITFDYIVDASGRAGIINTKYLKDRTYNQGLKNIANWGYWKGTDSYAVGTPRENSPYFEALRDESGWAWFIPLHNGTTSVGIVMNQEIATKKKEAQTPTPSAEELYLQHLKLAPNVLELIGSGKLLRNVEGPIIKSASDYSYSSSSYGAPGFRVVGDAGAFIDPYFSSGVHLALTGALSAALTICASLRGEHTEETAARWHSLRISTSYTRFLIVVLSAYKQIRSQEAAVLADFDEDNFDRAFAHFRPVIQGTADVGRSLSQEELTKTIEFCAHAFDSTTPEARDKVLAKVAAAQSSNTNGVSLARESAHGGMSSHVISPGFDTKLTGEEQRVLESINARRAFPFHETMHIQGFSADVIEGLRPRIERGNFGLESAEA